MATGGEPRSKLLDLVQCGLCLEKYNDSGRAPKLLPCAHTFCVSCVDSLYKSKLNLKLPCPNCREIFTIPCNGVQSLKTNLTVVSLLDHLAQAPATLEHGISPVVTVPPKQKVQESNHLKCGDHPGEKCDFYCHDCREPMCGDCMVHLNKGPHKSHDIKKLTEALTNFCAKREYAKQFVAEIKTESKKRIEELLKEWTISRDSLMKQAKDKRDEAYIDVDRLYEETTASISDMYDRLHTRIASMTDIGQLERALQKVDSQNIDGDLEAAQRFLDEVETAGTFFKKSWVWPAENWSFVEGKLDDHFTMFSRPRYLGRLTETSIVVPNADSFPYTIKYTDENMGKHNYNSGGENEGVKLLSCLCLETDSYEYLGLSANEAVMSFYDTNIMTRYAFRGTCNTVIELQRKNGSYLGRPFILDNNYCLIDKYDTGYGRGEQYVLLNEQLEVVSTFWEMYGTIIGAYRMDWVAFYNDKVIRIYDIEQEMVLQTLTPPEGYEWERAPPISRHPDSQFTAVVLRDTLHIYGYTGQHLITSSCLWKNDFYWTPAISMACNSRHVYVTCEDEMLVWTWGGQLVTTLNAQQLGIQPDTRIDNIAVSNNEFTIVFSHPLQLDICPSTVTSSSPLIDAIQGIDLQTFQISDCAYDHEEKVIVQFKTFQCI